MPRKLILTTAREQFLSHAATAPVEEVGQLLQDCATIVKARASQQSAGKATGAAARPQRPSAQAPAQVGPRVVPPPAAKAAVDPEAKAAAAAGNRQTGSAGSGASASAAGTKPPAPPKPPARPPVAGKAGPKNAPPPVLQHSAPAATAAPAADPIVPETLPPQRVDEDQE